MPIYVLKSNTIPQMQSSLTSIFSLEIDPREAAMRETEDAIEVGPVVVRGRSSCRRRTPTSGGSSTRWPSGPTSSRARAAASRTGASGSIRTRRAAAGGDGPARPRVHRPLGGRHRARRGPPADRPGRRAARIGPLRRVEPVPRPRPAARHRRRPHLAPALGPPRRAVAARPRPDVADLVPAGAGRVAARGRASRDVARDRGRRSASTSAASTSRPCRPSTPGSGRRSGRPRRRSGSCVRGSRTVYFAGDTDLFDGMAELGEPIDLALLPVWGWGPTLGRGLHLDPLRAAAGAAAASGRARPCRSTGGRTGRTRWAGLPGTAGRAAGRVRRVRRRARAGRADAPDRGRRRGGVGTVTDDLTRPYRPRRPGDRRRAADGAAADRSGPRRPTCARAPSAEPRPDRLRDRRARRRRRSASACWST